MNTVRSSRAARSSYTPTSGTRAVPQVECATEAERVLVTHGYTDTLVRWLRENGWAAETLGTKFTGEVMYESETPALA